MQEQSSTSERGKAYFSWNTSSLARLSHCQSALSIQYQLVRFHRPGELNYLDVTSGSGVSGASAGGNSIRDAVSVPILRRVQRIVPRFRILFCECVLDFPLCSLCPLW